MADLVSMVSIFTVAGRDQDWPSFLRATVAAGLLPSVNRPTPPGTGGAIRSVALATINGASDNQVTLVALQAALELVLEQAGDVNDPVRRHPQSLPNLKRIDAPRVNQNTLGKL